MHGSNLMYWLIDDIIYIGCSPSPAFAPPLVVGPDGTAISQTTAILAKLGKEFGFYPEPADEFNALQLALSVADFQMEGQNAFHPVDPSGSYADQIEEAKVSCAKFCDVRIPKWLNHFNHWITLRDTDYVFGNKLLYSDIALYHVIDACRFQFPDTFSQHSTDAINAYVSRVGSLPAIAAYEASSRCVPYGGDSMM